MLKRIEDAKKLVFSGPEEHVADPILKTLFAKEQPVIFSEEPKEKKVKREDLEKPTELADEKELEEMLENAGELSTEIVATRICPALLQHQRQNKRLLELCVPLLENHQDLLFGQVLIPMMVDEAASPSSISNHIPLTLLQHLNSTNQKKLLNMMVNHDNPHWQIVADLSNLDLTDRQVQADVAIIFAKQVDTNTKDTKMAKLILSLIKSIGSNMDSEALELWRQVVQMNQSFLKKSCEKELNKVA